MRRLSSMPAMIVLAAVLTAPVIIEAQNSLADPAMLPKATAPKAAVPTGLASTEVGASVYNVQNERIGGIAEVLTGNGDQTPGVVLSLGGFRGITGKVIEVPDGLIEVVNDKLVIAGATKDQLMQFPAYQYGSRS